MISPKSASKVLHILRTKSSGYIRTNVVQETGSPTNIVNAIVLHRYQREVYHISVEIRQRIIQEPPRLDRGGPEVCLKFLEQVQFFEHILQKTFDFVRFIRHGHYQLIWHQRGRWILPTSGQHSWRITLIGAHTGAPIPEHADAVASKMPWNWENGSPSCRSPRAISIAWLLWSFPRVEEFPRGLCSAGE